MKKRLLASAGGTTLIGIALATTVAGASAGAGAKPLPASSCSSIRHPGGKYLIASDLPLEGPEKARAAQMTRAITLVLEQRSWKAGRYTIAYQSCDDATAKAGNWDPGKAGANASAYSADPDVIGVIGTLNSGAAQIEIPILNRAPKGPIGMVSPANTYDGLTHGGPGTAAGDPGRYYPSGKRNYVRVIAPIDYQGAADAVLAQSFGIKKVFVLNDKEGYGLGIATNFKSAATKLGIKIVGSTAWDGKAVSYAALVAKVKSSGAQGVFLGGLVSEHGGKLIKDIRAGVARSVRIMLPDGFTPVSTDVRDAGAAAEGATVSVAGLPNSQLGSVGKTFVSQFTKADHQAPDPYAVYAAQAAQVLLQAISKSNGTRADVAAKLFQTKVTNGILGSFSINKNGDTTSDPVTIYEIKGGQPTMLRVIIPPAALVRSS